MTRHFRVTAAITNARSGTVRRVAALRKVSRRTVLTTGAATVAAASMSGCGWENGAQATSAADDVALVTDALDDEVAFAEMCEQVRRRYRRLAARIDVVISGQREHTDALTATLGQSCSLMLRPPRGLASAPSQARAASERIRVYPDSWPGPLPILSGSWERHWAV